MRRVLWPRRLAGRSCAPGPNVPSQSGLRLAMESFQRGAVVAQVLWKELEGHVSMEARVLGLVHHTHAASSELPEDAVARESLPDSISFKCFCIRWLASRTPSSARFNSETSIRVAILSFWPSGSSHARTPINTGNRPPSFRGKTKP
jgi:hypothetical protein